MSNNTTSLVDTARRFMVRAVLELSQGATVKPSKKGDRDEWIPGNIEESLNNPYINREGIPLAMDIFKPVGPEYEGKDLPVIVSIHGGGLVTGDRKISLNLCREMASRGYLVFAIEYRLAPRATVCEQLDDVCAGMDFVGKKLVKYDVDFTRIFMTADSAGAFLAIYTAAMKKSKKLQEAIGYEPSRMVFKALGLSCGMFYTNRNDILGQMLSEQFYGDKLDDENFLQYMNPEHPEIISNLPPTFLVTSRGDFLNNYTVMFEKALKNAGNTTKMLYYPGENLIHTFNFSRPWLPESKDANDKMLAFFEEQAAVARSKQGNQLQAKKKNKAIAAKMDDGSFAKQRLWEAVESSNDYSEERLDAVAELDEHKRYTYRQMFRKWRDYAEVFSALNMTGADASRVGMPGAMTIDAVNAFYALNMTGASVSMMPYGILNEPEKFADMVQDEKLTDLILTDYETPEKLLIALKKNKGKLGLRKIIILQTPEGIGRKKDLTLGAVMKDVPGMHFMKDLLVSYEAFPITWANAETASEIILHKLSFDKKQCEAISFTDEDLNAFAVGILNSTRDQIYPGHSRVGLTMDLFSMHSLIRQVQMTFLINNTLVATYKVGYLREFYKKVQEYHINILVAYPELLELWMNKLKEENLNLSALDLILLENTGITKEELAKYTAFASSKKGKVTFFTCAEKGRDYTSDPMHYGVPDLESALQDFGALLPLVPYAGPAVQEKLLEAKKNFNHLQEQRKKNEERMKTIQIVAPAVLSMVRQNKNAKSSDSPDVFMSTMSKLFSANEIDYYFEA